MIQSFNYFEIFYHKPIFPDENDAVKVFVEPPEMMLIIVLNVVDKYCDPSPVMNKNSVELSIE